MSELFCHGFTILISVSVYSIWFSIANIFATIKNPLILRFKNISHFKSISYIYEQSKYST